MQSISFIQLPAVEKGATEGIREEATTVGRAVGEPFRLEEVGANVTGDEGALLPNPCG